MGKGVAVYAQRLADLDLNAQLLANLTPQAGGQVFAILLLAAGELPQPAQQALRGALSQQHLPGALDHRRGDGVMRDGRPGGQHRALLLHAQGFGLAQVSQRAKMAGWGARGADLRPQVHQGLVIIAGPAGRQVLGGQLPQAGLAARRAGVFGHIEQARQHAADVAIQGRLILPKSDRGNRPGGIAPNARQLAQLPGIRRQLAAMLFVHDLRGTLQVACPAVIAQPLPGRQHLLLGGRRQRRNARKALHPALEIKAHRFHAGLLEHDL